MIMIIDQLRKVASFKLHMKLYSLSQSFLLHIYRHFSVAGGTYYSVIYRWCNNTMLNYDHWSSIECIKWNVWSVRPPALSSFTYGTYVKACNVCKNAKPTLLGDLFYHAVLCYSICYSPSVHLFVTSLSFTKMDKHWIMQTVTYIIAQEFLFSGGMYYFALW